MTPVVSYSESRPYLRPENAFSAEARIVRDAIRNIAEGEERSYALFGSKAAAISDLWAILDEHSVEDWNGEGALPVDILAVVRAEQFIRALPNDLPVPEFAADPDGAVSLDWIRSRNRMLSVSAGLTDRLAYAWLDGTDKSYGVATFTGDAIPQEILDAIRRIAGRIASPLRPS